MVVKTAAADRSDVLTVYLFISVNYLFIPRPRFCRPVGKSCTKPPLSGTMPPMRHTPFQAVIFDLDGTLVNSLDDLANATNEALRWAGYPEHPVEAYKYFVGNGLDMLMRRALPEGVEPPDYPALLDCLRASYDASWHQCSRPYEGINDLLLTLQARQFPMAVLSNKPDDWTVAYVRHFFPDIRFQEVRGARTGVPHKPAPQSALDVAAMLGHAPQSIAFVGDSSVDMLTAGNSGMFGIGVTWGFRTEQELLESGSQRIIHRPEELPPILLNL